MSETWWLARVRTEAGAVETLRALLYSTSPFDPRVLGGATLVLALVGLLASVLPALRAAKVDPIGVLREE